MAEYAKFVRLYAPTSSGAGRGYQARIKLPSSKTLGGDYDYINYYVGMGGYECGISTSRRPEFKDPVTGAYKWRWFANNSIGDKKDEGAVEWSDGSTITIKLTLDDKTNKATFYINDETTPRYTATQVYTGTLTNCRLVLGAAQASGTATPLSAWRVWQNNVTASNLYYKNSGKTWVSVTTGSPNKFYEPAVSSATMPDPDNWTCPSSFTGGTFSASIVQP